MTAKTLPLLLTPALLLLGSAGCNHCCRNKCANGPAAAGPVIPAAPQPGYLPPHAVSPMQSAPVQPPPPPAPMSPAPAAPYSPPPAAPYSPPPAPPPSGLSGYGPTPSPVESRWQPAPGPGVRLQVPESATAPTRDNVRLQPPVGTEPPPSRPALNGQTQISPSLPVGIPQFAVGREGVTSGLRPSAEGFDWLRSNGYHTVLHLHGPGADDSADRKAVEDRGLGFLSVAVSPETVTQAAEEFNRIVNHRPNYPLFVYDGDGVRTGSLWYLYFRVVDRVPDDAARRKAAALGLREDAQGEAGTMWVAMQQFLRSKPQP